MNQKTTVTNISQNSQDDLNFPGPQNDRNSSPKEQRQRCRQNIKWEKLNLLETLWFKKGRISKENGPKKRNPAFMQTIDQPIFNRRMKEGNPNQAERFLKKRWKHLELRKELFLKSEEVLFYNTNLSI